MRKFFSIYKTSFFKKSIFFFVGLFSFWINTYPGEGSYGTDSAAICEEDNISLFSPLEVQVACAAPAGTKIPNIATVCQGTMVSATFTPLAGCTILAEYSTNAGLTWTPFVVPPYEIAASVIGTNTVRIRGSQTCGGCNGLPANNYTTYQWTVVAQPSVTLTKSAASNTPVVCNGKSVSATITRSGGTGYIDTLMWFNDITGVWANYPSGTNINSAGHSSITIIARRSDCPPLSGCISTPLQSATWFVNPNPTNPTLATRTPDTSNICQGKNVSATFFSGSGGVGCRDTFQYQYNNTGAWFPYIPGTDINTAGYNSVRIRGSRACDPLAGCSVTWMTLTSWTLVPQPVAKDLTKYPASLNIPITCKDRVLTASTSGGSGGGPAGSYTDQYSRYTDTSGWSGWSTTVPNFPAVLGQDSIRSRRISILPGCNESPYKHVAWTVVESPEFPTVNVKTPNTDSVCNGTLLSATFNPGLGGAGCLDTFQYRFNNTGTWFGYIPGTPLNSAGYSSLVIRGARLNCVTGCVLPGWTPSLVSWTIAPPPAAPTASSINPPTPVICGGQLVSASFNPGTGGSASCTDQFRYSFDGSGIWNPYVSGVTTISSAGHTLIEIQSRRECDPLTGCSSTAWNTAASWTVSPQPSSPTLNTRFPDMDTICRGTPVSATFNPGTGGNGCTDYFQYCFNGAGTWINYVPGDNINTSGNHSSVQIRGIRANCNYSSGCVNSSWSILVNMVIRPQPVAPKLNAKTPNIVTVCEGQNVSATFIMGTGGVNCTDQFRYDDGGGWMPYTPGTNISTTGKTFVMIQGSRDGCKVGAGCSGTSWDTLAYWTVAPKPSSPTLNAKTPNLPSVCSGQNVFATFNPGTDGVSCADQYQYRYDGGAWSAYTSGAVINTSGHTSVEIRGQRFNCNPYAGCANSAWDTLADWTIEAQPGGPTLNVKTPAVPGVCDGQDVSATFNAGTGGAGCTDQFEYRYDGIGLWTPYVAGTNISSTGHTLIEIQGQRSNCSPGAGCASTPWNTLASWNVAPIPVGPTLSTKSPNVPTVCQGVVIAAFFNPGTGGIGCTDKFEYRYDGGSWTPYSPGSNILTVGHTLLEIQGQRSGCADSTGCTGTPWVILSSWSIVPQPVSPTLNTKIPDLASVCEGQLVSATVNAGSGGNGCRDSLRYRYDGSGTWLPYVSGENIPTNGHFSVTIAAQRGNCSAGSGCNATSWQEIASWNIRPHPSAPAVNQKSPNLASVCAGQDVFATFNPGTGGVGCVEQFQYRYDGAGGWNAYIPGNILSTAGHTLVEIQSQQTACEPAAGCISPGWTTATSWIVESQPIAPTVNVITPNLASVCSGQDVSVTFNAGSGGVGCTDQYQYRYDGSGNWFSYVPGTNILTGGHTLVEIESRRSGCTGGAGCMGTSWTPLVNWVVAAQPASPTINVKTPNLPYLCAGENASATFNAGTGGVGCTDQYQYSFDGSGTWNIYTPGNNINTLGHTLLEIQGQRMGCTVDAGCTSSAWTTIASWTIQPQPVNPTVYSISPNLAGVCSGQPVSAVFNAGTGGMGCTDQYQFRYDGVGIWSAYTPGANINTTGHTLVEIQARRMGCIANIGCSDTAWTTPPLVTWTVSSQPAVPVVNVKSPNLTSVCEGLPVSATFNISTGGVGCSDNFEYRYDGMGFWMPYTPGTSLPTTGHTKVEIQGQRTGCIAGAGCVGTSWVTLATWNVQHKPIAPILNGKSPSSLEVCVGQPVSATFHSGSGGVGCSDEFQYADQSGVWTTYTPGTSIETTGRTSVSIRGRRAGCTVEASCLGTDWTTLASWSIQPQPVAPTINFLTPNQDSVCNGEMVSAMFNAGSGGVSCVDQYQYRFDGTGAWTPYSPGTSIFTAGHTSIVIQGRRNGCNPVSGCMGTIWADMARWEILGKLTGPSIDVKTPNLTDICDSSMVSATFKPGTGGNGCSDLFRYRFDTTGAWSDYTPGTQISTLGHFILEIQGQRSSCSVCSSTPWAPVVSWKIHAQPGSPSINSIHPNLPIICAGQNITATFVPGTGGAGCADNFEYRYDSTGSWIPYIPGSNINTSKHSLVELQGRRTACANDAGCTSSQWTALAQWKVFPQPTYPVIDSLIPNQETICEGVPVMATFDTGTGGVNSVDLFQYRFDNTGSWIPYNGTQLITTDHNVVQIQAMRTGGTPGSGCKALPWKTLASWGIYVKPEISSIEEDSVCGSGRLSLIVFSPTPYATIDWYDSLVGGTKIITTQNGEPWRTPVIYVTTTYYVDAAQKGCVTDYRMPVKAIIYTCDDIVKDSIPNFFSPNEDGVNDFWDFDMSNHPQSIVMVFNKWGQVVWESEKGYPNKWDGNKRGGNPVPDGGYNFVIIENGKVIKTGGLVILRAR